MIRLTGLPQPADQLQFTPDGRELVAVWRDWTAAGLVRWDWTAGRVTQRAAADGVRLSACGGFHARGAGGSVRLFVGRGRRPLVAVPGGTAHLAVAPGGTELMTWEGVDAMCFRRLPGGAQLARRPARLSGYAPGYSPGGRWAHAVGRRTIRLWDRPAGHRVRLLPGESLSSVVAVSPDDRLMAVSGNGSDFAVWDLAGPQPAVRVVLPAAARAFAWHPDAVRLLSADPGGSVRLWDAAAGREVAGWDFGVGGATAAAVSPDGLVAAAAGWDTAVVVWDL